MNREIPGFYYDPEKKKYFRIQASHKATPGSQYSKDAVKRKRDEQEINQRKARYDNQLAKEKIKKASFLYHPLLGLEQEAGTQKVYQHRDLLYASQVHREELHKFEPWPNEYSIGHVMRNRQSGVLVAGGSRGGESSVSVCFPDWEEGKWIYDRTMERVMFKDPYRLSSMSLSHTGCLLAAMDSGPQGDAFFALRNLPNPDEGGDYRWPSRLIHPIHIHMPEHTLWSTAAAPRTSSSTAPFALGTSHGLHILRAEGPYWSLSHHSVPYSKHFDLDIDQQLGTDSTHVQVTSIEWLSSEVVAAGLRDSTVFLHDLRSNGCATRLKHPSAVTGIKKVDEWRVVVGGFGSDLHMYDLRYPPKDLDRQLKAIYTHPGGRNRNRNRNRNRTRNANASQPSTKPYLVFPKDTHHIWSANSSTLGFDLSLELGLLATASENRVVLYSLRTGEEIPSTYPISQYRYPNPISALRFDGSADEGACLRGPQTPGLLVCAGDTVDEWNW